MEKLDLDFLNTFRVTTKNVKDMTVEEAKHELEVKIATKDPKKPEQDLTLVLARHVLDLSPAIPNSDRIRVPQAHIESASEQLLILGKSDLLNEQIQIVLNKLNGNIKEVEQSETKYNETQNEIKDETKQEEVTETVTETKKPKSTPNSTGGKLTIEKNNKDWHEDRKAAHKGGSTRTLGGNSILTGRNV